MKRDALARVVDVVATPTHVGVGDPTSDLALAIQNHIAATRAAAAAYPNDLSIGGLVAQAESLLTLLDAAQAQLNAVNVTPTIQSVPPTTPTCISAPAAGFIAVGAAFVGGIAGWAGRGIMEKKR